MLQAPKEFLDRRIFSPSPYQPDFNNWAFGAPLYSRELRQIWARIPDDVDVLITHGPPANILDLTFQGIHAGCPDLLARVKQVQPRLHVFGHIHEGYGREEHDSTIFVNASTCNMRCQPCQSPMIVDL